jgi:hypothetical protein
MSLRALITSGSRGVVASETLYLICLNEVTFECRNAHFNSVLEQMLHKTKLLLQIIKAINKYCHKFAAQNEPKDIL